MTNTCCLMTQWVKLGRIRCWSLKSNQFQSQHQCHLSFVTEYVTMGVVKTLSLPHLVSLFLMSQMSSLVWGLTLGLCHAIGQLPLSGFLLICHSDCMDDFTISVPLLAVCPHKNHEFKPIQPTGVLPVFVNINVAGPSVCPVSLHFPHPWTTLSALSFRLPSTLKFVGPRFYKNTGLYSATIDICVFSKVFSTSSHLHKSP